MDGSLDPKKSLPGITLILWYTEIVQKQKRDDTLPFPLHVIWNHNLYYDCRMYTKPDADNKLPCRHLSSLQAND